jgi:hypothetical protein
MEQFATFNVAGVLVIESGSITGHAHAHTSDKAIEAAARRSTSLPVESGRLILFSAFLSDEKSIVHTLQVEDRDPAIVQSEDVRLVIADLLRQLNA